jgi:hypothetical protein
MNLRGRGDGDCGEGTEESLGGYRERRGTKIRYLSAVPLQQQCFDVAMDQHGYIILNARGLLKLGALPVIECFDELPRHICFARQIFDFRIVIGWAFEQLPVHRK